MGAYLYLTDESHWRPYPIDTSAPCFRALSQRASVAGQASLASVTSQALPFVLAASPRASVANQDLPAWVISPALLFVLVASPQVSVASQTSLASVTNQALLLAPAAFPRAFAVNQDLPASVTPPLPSVRVPSRRASVGNRDSPAWVTNQALLFARAASPRASVESQASPASVTSRAQPFALAPSPQAFVASQDSPALETSLGLLLIQATSHPRAAAAHTSTVTQDVHSIHNDGHMNVVGRDSIRYHTHLHYHGTTVDLESVMRAIPNFRKIHQDTWAKAAPGTGMWLLRSDTISLWLEPNGDLKIIWGSGIPGAGKTILASLVIDMLETLAGTSSREICVAFVYIRYSDSDQVTVRGVLEVLLKQTLERYPRFLPIVHQVYVQHLSDGTQPTEAQLMALLQQTTGQVASFYILDALDEAPIAIQLDLVKQLSSLNCKIFVTSRPLKVVEAHFPCAHSFSIVAQEGDIELLIKQKLESSAGLQGLLAKSDASLQEKIVERIKVGCGGMFLHAALQLDAVCQCISILEVEETLEEFPSAIEGVYVQTWNRILSQTPKHTLLAKALLSWVLNAQRPMTVEELQHAVAASPDTHNFQPARLVPEVSTLIGLCRGMLTVEEESNVVRLVHYTAKETVGRLLVQSFPRPDSHMAAVCMTRLTDCGFHDAKFDSDAELEQALQCDPLLAYAFDSWTFHARKSLDVDSTSRHLTAFLALCCGFPTLTPGTAGLDHLGTLHLVSLWDIPFSFAEPHGADDPNIGTRTGGYTALVLACWVGHYAAVQSLLDLPNIDVNVVNVDGVSALMMAASNGHEQIVKLLLAHPEIDVNLADADGWSALIRAASNGEEGTVELLNARSDTEINLVDADGWTALTLATENGHTGTVKQLLTRAETKVNLAVLAGGCSALMYAASMGYLEIVALLLAHPDIEVNAVDIKGRSALMKAASMGHTSTIALLAAHPQTKINLADNNGTTALMWSTLHGFDAAIEPLLAHHEIHVNQVDTEGWSALMLAAHYGHEPVVALLLANPNIDVNLVDHHGYSALMTALSEGLISTVKPLLEHPEIDTTIANFHGTTALLLASEFGYTEVVKVLLTNPRTDVNSIDGHGDTSIKLAAEHGHEDVVALLLESPGIDITITSTDNGHTALSAALANRHEGIVCRLQIFAPSDVQSDPGASQTEDVAQQSDDSEEVDEVDSDDSGLLYEDALDSL
ncbi:ankyrin repeat-containing domain protein [Coprinopsis sp. MPI-PUGE-AT-0042]|nr:ankyrin repeat-containing domain protein [Coprinopsis sp. MPI-PUGE-AT-0042]